MGHSVDRSKHSDLIRSDRRQIQQMSNISTSPLPQKQQEKEIGLEKRILFYRSKSKMYLSYWHILIIKRKNLSG